jgi:acetoin utilization deacetylase AcuC-like enzyme
VSLLEGGYNPARLAESVEAHLRELIAATNAPQPPRKPDDNRGNA